MQQVAVSELFGIPRSTLSRAVASYKRGKNNAKQPVDRPPRLTETKERTVIGAILDFSGDGTPLSRSDIAILGRLFVLGFRL